METIDSPPTRSQQPPLRAMVEIIDGQLKIFPVARSDKEAKDIIDALLLWKSDA